MKSILTSASVLTILAGITGFSVYTDASGTGLGVVLMADMADAVYRVSRQQGSAFVVSLLVMPRVYTQVVTAQRDDQQVQQVLCLPEVSYSEDDIVRFRNRLYVPSAARQELCDEVHRLKLNIHPGRNKIY